MPLSPCISRFQRDSWKLRRSHYGSFSMPLSQAKMLILPGRRLYTRSSASWIVKSLRFSNPQTAYKSCFMSRNFNNSFRMYEQQQSPLDVQVIRVQILIFIYMCMGGMDVLQNQLVIPPHHLSLIFFCFPLQGDGSFPSAFSLLLPKALNIWRLKIGLIFREKEC